MIGAIERLTACERGRRTLTILYNDDRPAWLEHAHRNLDRAVAAAYGWEDWDSAWPDDEILKRLFVLNQQRALA